MGTYIHNLANSLMFQLGVRFIDVCPDLEHEGETRTQLLLDRQGAQIKRELSKMNSETLGRIVAQGQGGEELLRDIACKTIVAEMGEILGDRQRAVTQFRAEG